jgi:hypothetical protein
VRSRCRRRRIFECVPRRARGVDTRILTHADSASSLVSVPGRRVYALGRRGEGTSRQRESLQILAPTTQGHVAAALEGWLRIYGDPELLTRIVPVVPAAFDKHDARRRP